MGRDAIGATDLLHKFFDAKVEAWELVLMPMRRHHSLRRIRLQFTRFSDADHLISLTIFVLTVNEIVTAVDKRPNLDKTVMSALSFTRRVGNGSVRPIRCQHAW